MFLKRNRRRKGGQTYEYWSLVQTVRTAKGPRHRTVCNLGKLPGLDQQHRYGWEDLIDLLEGTEPPPKQQVLGTACTESHKPEWMQVDVKGLRVERVRDFGEVYLALALWRRLGLHRVLEELMPRGRETVFWPLVACVLTVARFCGNKSELGVAKRWYQDSALADLLGLDWQQVYDNRLYRGLDVLIAHKDALCQHLLERYQSWFGVDFEFLLYDVTSTYFEGKAQGNAKAKRGYSTRQALRLQTGQHRSGRHPRRRTAHWLRSLRRQPRRHEHGRRDGATNGGKIRTSKSHLGDGSRHGQRGKPRFFT